MKSLKLPYLKIFLLLLIPLSGFAQNKKIEILNADKLLGGNAMPNKARRLIGNVVFLHDGAKMYCDSAWFYSEENKLDAFGKVRIVQDSLDIKSKFLSYSGQNKMASLSGDVVLKDGQMTLYTDQLNYDRENKVGYYTNGGKLVDPENTLTSIRGIYYSKTNTAFFSDSVRLKNIEYTMQSDTLIYITESKRSEFAGETIIKSDENTIICNRGWYNSSTEQSSFYNRASFIKDGQSLLADSLYYNRNKQYSYAYKNVVLNDTTEGISLYGQTAEYWGLDGISEVRDSAYLAIATESDSLYVHSDTFRIVEDSLEEKDLFAYSGVRMFQSEMQGICDTMHYVGRDSMLYFLGDPVLWAGENQLSAKFMKAKFVNGQVHKLFLDELAFLINLDSLENYNQVKGLSMRGYFRDNELREIRVNGNAQSIYFAREENNELVGVDFAKAARMKILVAGNEIQSVQYYQQVESDLKPENEVKSSETSLEGFRWRSLERPTDRWDIFKFPSSALPIDSIQTPSDSLR